MIQTRTIWLVLEVKTIVSTGQISIAKKKVKSKKNTETEVAVKNT